MEIQFKPHYQLPQHLANRNSVLWKMALVARNGSDKSFKLLQESVNLLSEKVRNGSMLESDEASFVLALLLCPWWGGKDWGLSQTESFTSVDDGELLKPVDETLPRNVADPLQMYTLQMHLHFCEGQGSLFAVSLPVFRNSLIVKDVVEALKKYALDASKRGSLNGLISTSDRGFLESSFAKGVEAKRKQSEIQGFLFSDGTMLLDQKDPRIMNVGNRFKIQMVSTKLAGFLSLQFRLEGLFKFESFDGLHGTTGLPLSDKHTLVIPNGLFASLASLGCVTPFKYFASWSDRVAANKM